MCVFVYEYDFLCTARYMTKSFFFVCGVRLIQLARSIQDWGGVVRKFE